MIIALPNIRYDIVVMIFRKSPCVSYICADIFVGYCRNADNTNFIFGPPSCSSPNNDLLRVPGPIEVNICAN